jgi:hypothetical protein
MSLLASKLHVFQFLLEEGSTLDSAVNIHLVDVLVCWLASHDGLSGLEQNPGTVLD